MFIAMIGIAFGVLQCCVAYYRCSCVFCTAMVQRSTTVHSMLTMLTHGCMNIQLEYCRMVNIRGKT